ncbi:hypothetical protein JXI42_13685 [bacterium]|nr:hypothetical protein [bacterium]
MYKRKYIVPLLFLVAGFMCLFILYSHNYSISQTQAKEFDLSGLLALQTAEPDEGTNVSDSMKNPPSEADDKQGNSKKLDEKPANQGLLVVEPVFDGSDSRRFVEKTTPSKATIVEKPQLSDADLRKGSKAGDAGARKRPRIKPLKNPERFFIDTDPTTPEDIKEIEKRENFPDPEKNSDEYISTYGRPMPIENTERDGDYKFGALDPEAELIHLRTPASRHYLGENGKIYAIFTTVPTSYQDSEGEWHDIDFDNPPARMRSRADSDSLPPSPTSPMDDYIGDYRYGASAKYEESDTKASIWVCTPSEDLTCWTGLHVVHHDDFWSGSWYEQDLYRGFVQFNISSIASGSAISNVGIKVKLRDRDPCVSAWGWIFDYNTYLRFCRWTNYSILPSSYYRSAGNYPDFIQCSECYDEPSSCDGSFWSSPSTDGTCDDLFDYAGTGGVYNTLYVYNSSSGDLWFPSSGYFTLGTSAASNLQARIGYTYFVMAFRCGNDCGMNCGSSSDGVGINYAGTELFVEYAATGGICVVPPAYDYTISPSASWQTHGPQTFLPGGCRIYRMLLDSDYMYNFSICSGDGVGGYCSPGDGDFTMYSAAGADLWYVDGESGCSYDATTLGTSYEDWVPPADGYYYLKVSEYYVAGATYVLAYKSEALGACIPPTNETCTGAIEIAETYYYSGMLGCTDDCSGRPYYDTFFEGFFSHGKYDIDMCGSTGDTYMRVYDGGCCSGLLGENDNGCGGLDPLIELTVTGGGSAFIWFECGSNSSSGMGNSPYLFNVKRTTPKAYNLEYDIGTSFSEMQCYAGQQYTWSLRYIDMDGAANLDYGYFGYLVETDDGYFDELFTITFDIDAGAGSYTVSHPTRVTVNSVTREVLSTIGYKYTITLTPQWNMENADDCGFDVVPHYRVESDDGDSDPMDDGVSWYSTYGDDMNMQIENDVYISGVTPASSDIHILTNDPFTVEGVILYDRRPDIAGETPPDDVFKVKVVTDWGIPDVIDDVYAQHFYIDVNTPYTVDPLDCGDHYYDVVFNNWPTGAGMEDAEDILIYVIGCCGYEVPIGTWHGCDDDDWDNARNWGGNVVPSSTTPDLVTIPTSPEGGRFPRISSTGNKCRDINIQAGATLNIDSGGELEVYHSYDMWVYGELYVNSGASLFLGDALDVYGKLSVAGGTVTNNYETADHGKFFLQNGSSGSMTSGTMTFYTNVTAYNNTTWKATGGTFKCGGANYEVVIEIDDADVCFYDFEVETEVGAKLSGSAYELDINNDLDLYGKLNTNGNDVDVDGITYIYNGGELEGNTGVTTTDFYTDGTIVYAGGILDWNADNFTNDVSALNVSGNLSQDGGVINNSASQFYFFDGSSFGSRGGTINNSGANFGTSGTGNKSIHLPSDHILNLNAGTSNFYSRADDGGDIDWGNVFVYSPVTVYNSPDDYWEMDALSISSSGSVNHDNGASYYPLTKVLGDVLVAGTYTMDQTADLLDVNGDLTINGSGHLTSTAADSIFLAGDWINNGDFAHGNNIVIFDGTGTEIAPQLITGGASTYFYDVFISSGTVVQIEIHTYFTNEIEVEDGAELYFPSTIDEFDLEDEDDD